MVVRPFRSTRFVGGLLAGLVLVLAGGSALAFDGGPVQHAGDKICGYCHSLQYESYIKHGHPWVEMATNRESPEDPNNPGVLLDKFPSWEAPFPTGVPLPHLPDLTLSANGVTRKMQWSDVVSLLGFYKEGDGYMIIDPPDMPSLSGRRAAHGALSSAYPSRCFKCHNTGVVEFAAGTPNALDPTKHEWGIPGMPAKAALPGIQCEQCHGAFSMNMPEKQICRDCHSSGDATFRARFDLTTGLFSRGHGEGDEYRRSPHKDRGCFLCHDPHKSVWNEDGGVKWAEAEGIGNMCKTCHTMQLRGGHGEIGLECVDCHMPERSGNGERASHLFRITTEPLTYDQNVFADPPGSTTYYLNTDANGDSFLTLDLVCTNCHDNMTIEQMSKKAKAIHREPNLLDLTVNGFDSLRVVKTTQKVLVAFSVECGDEKGKKATWSVLCQGPRGWTYWNGKAWVRGNKPWRTGVAINDIARQVVLNGKITAKGYYTYWASIRAADGGEFVDSVPVLVK